MEMGRPDDSPHWQFRFDFGSQAFEEFSTPEPVIESDTLDLEVVEPKDSDGQDLNKGIAHVDSEQKKIGRKEKIEAYYRGALDDNDGTVYESRFAKESTILEINIDFLKAPKKDNS